MSTLHEPPERALILAPRGRDAAIACAILREAGIQCDVCPDLEALVEEIQRGANVAIVTEETIRSSDVRQLTEWAERQHAWSDFPFVVLTKHGGGIERNPSAARITTALGNVTFLERPFHPTTLVSVVQTGLRGRQRQLECRRLNEELEFRVDERTAELASANRQLLTQIEERERVESTLRRMQRLEAVGQLTSGVAHDFNNLLTVVLGNVGFLERDLVRAGIDGKALERLSYMRTAAERGAKLTDQLLSFSRRQRLEPKVIDLHESLSGLRDLLQSTIGGRIRVETQLGAALWPALVDLTQLELAILNLSINARDAMPEGGSLKVQAANCVLERLLSPEDPPPGDYVVVRVQDTGTGMSEEVRAKAFEPFFTTKEIGKGSGLGLSQVLGFAKQSGGGVRIQSTQGVGTTIEIYLPRADSKPDVVDRALSRAESADRAGTSLLLVDDDNDVRNVTAAILRDLGYVIVEAGSGGAALELLEYGPDIDLALIDFAMPGMNGAELARRVRAMRPALPILFVTGYADRTALPDVKEAEVIRKPFVDSELVDKVRAILANSPSADAGHRMGSFG
jgi:signal transduction histidine kinase/ActR/RegA family two-component response regulator